MTKFPLALIGDVGGMELVVIMGAILILFGGKGLPGIARSFGKMTETLRRASQDFKNQLMEADRDLTAGPMDDPTANDMARSDPSAAAAETSKEAEKPKEALPRDPAG